MTDSLATAIEGLVQVRVGRAICEPNGHPGAEVALEHGVYRVSRRAGLPERVSVSTPSLAISGP